MSKIYSGQISYRYGCVCAEVICTNDFYKDNLTKNWIAISRKDFQRNIFSLSHTIREKDCIKAKKWLEEQLDIMSNYGTTIIVKPEWL